MQKQSNFLALDVGLRRVGVAIADGVARLPRPYTTLDYGPDVIDEIIAAIAKEHVGTVVVGLPRGLDGQDTSQTAFTREFIEQLQQHTETPIHTQDEAVTSAKAREELEARGKPFTKQDVDALAATYILEDFLRDKL